MELSHEHKLKRRGRTRSYSCKSIKKAWSSSSPQQNVYGCEPFSAKHWQILEPSWVNFPCRRETGSAKQVSSQCRMFIFKSPAALLPEAGTITSSAQATMFGQGFRPGISPLSRKMSPRLRLPLSRDLHRLLCQTQHLLLRWWQLYVWPHTASLLLLKTMQSDQGNYTSNLLPRGCMEDTETWCHWALFALSGIKVNKETWDYTFVT